MILNHELLLVGSSSGIPLNAEILLLKPTHHNLLSESYQRYLGLCSVSQSFSLCASVFWQCHAELYSVARLYLVCTMPEKSVGSQKFVPEKQ